MPRRHSVEEYGRDEAADEGGDRQEKMPKTCVTGARILPLSTIIATAPRLEPAETPIRPGSASGLRNRPCMTAPETASPPPIRKPRMARGRRMSKMMMRSRAAQHVVRSADGHAADNVDDRGIRCAGRDRERESKEGGDHEAGQDDESERGAVALAMAVGRSTRHALHPRHDLVECHLSPRRSPRSARARRLRCAA